MVTSIIFKKTSNVFINAGIIGLSRYIEKYKMTNPDAFPTLKVSPILANRLTICCDHLLDFLEEVYYFMGKEKYDTSSNKQRLRQEKLFFVEEPFSFHHFPRMNSYGLSGFLTKAPYGPQPVPRKPENAVYFKKIFKEKPGFAKKIAHKYRENEWSIKGFNIEDEAVVEDKTNVKGDSRIFLNEPYTKTPILPFSEEYLDSGDNYCSIVNEGFKKLLSSKGCLPFSSSLENFNSYLGSDDQRKISFKAKYLALFAPGISLHNYQNNYKTVFFYFLDSSTLSNISSLYEWPIFLQEEELQKNNYRINFYLRSFAGAPRGVGKKEFSINDCIWESEMAFRLIYTFYKDRFELDLVDLQPQAQSSFDPFEDIPLEKIPISLVSVRADQFSQTMRPTSYEKYNNVKFIIRLFYALEANQIPIGLVWHGLKLKSQKTENITAIVKKMAAERQIRAKVCAKVLRGKSITQEVENLFLGIFRSLTTTKIKPEYRNYNKIVAFLLLYEKSIQFENHKHMTEELQNRAIKLGRSVAHAVLHFENPTDENGKRTNAKGGRKYIIRLHKARTEGQFTEALIAIMQKYGVSISNEILENLNKNNFIMIRQYIVIGALNGINAVLTKTKNNS